MSVKQSAIVALLLVYFLIFIGSFVRSTGAGMGCPDWPKCFDRFVPPASEADLPADYADRLLEKRIQKNKRLTRFLNFLGVDTSNSQHIEEKIFFNVKKAWIEYLNRIVGVLVGFSIVIFWLLSIFKSKDTKIKILSSISLFLVLFQGWIGSLVVSTNLVPGIISIHMVLAILMCFVLIYTVFYMSSSDTVMNFKSYLKYVVVSLIILSIIQIFVGVKLRELVDQVLKSIGMMNQQTLDSFGFVFLFHRSYSLIILILNCFVIYNLYKSKSFVPYSLDKILILCILFSILTGASFYYFNYPLFLQPFHLLLSNIIIGIQFYLFLLLSKNKNNQNHVC